MRSPFNPARSRQSRQKGQDNGTETRRDRGVLEPRTLALAPVRFGGSQADLASGCYAAFAGETCQRGITMIARAKFPLEVTLLACCSAVGSPAEALTERQVLQRFRESPYHRELEAGIRVVREGNRRHSLYPNPNISATFEGAGRTDFFMVEQPIVVNGRRNLLSQAGDSAVKVAQTSAAHTLRQVESQLRQSFYQLVYAQGRQRLIREGQSELEGIARILREREIAGEGSRFDRLRAELEIANLESEAVETETLVTTSRAKLAGFLGDLVVSDTLRAIGDMDAAYGLPALGEAFADALSARSDYKLETQRLEQLRLEGEAAKRLRIPNPVVSGGVKRAEVGGQFFNGPVLAFGIDVPLFSKGQVDPGIGRGQSRESARTTTYPREPDPRRCPGRPRFASDPAPERARLSAAGGEPDARSSRDRASRVRRRRTGHSGIA